MKWAAVMAAIALCSLGGQAAGTPHPERDTVAQHLPQLYHCHAREAATEKAVLHLTIAPDGTVAGIRVESDSRDLASCVERVARRWKFQRADKERQFHWPVVFAAG